MGIRAAVVLGCLMFSSVLAADTPPPVGDVTRAGWNAYATRFLYAPTLEVNPVKSAASYSITLAGGETSQTVTANQPQVSLESIWPKLPAAASYNAWIEAHDREGNVIGRSAAFRVHKVAPFDGHYPPGARGYGDAGRDCAEYLLRVLKDWKTERDPAAVTQINYPALFYASYVNVLATCGTDDALKIARNIARYTMATSTPADWKYPHLPLSHKPGQYLQLSRAAMVGCAYLKLYDATKDPSLLDAANSIADTLKSRQLPDSRWPFRVNPQTGDVVEDYTSDQAEAIDLFDELIDRHGRNDLIAARDKAVQWMLNNPVKTNLWQQQWDDIPLLPPYKDLEFYDTALFAMRQAKANDIATARKLFDWIEDQFVLWENSYNPQFIAPGVKEQYRCYIPIDFHAGHFIRLCIAMHRATGEEIYLAKAKAMADSLTRVQHPDGYFATWMRKAATQPVDFERVWPDCYAYTAQSLIELDRYLKR